MDFYGTIGPACADAALLQQMVEAGMTGIRMNLSHGPLAAHADWLALLRKAEVKKLLIDLQGPELRIGRLPQPLSLTAGQTVRLGAQGIPCPTALVQGVQPGQELLLDDGKLLARVDTAEPEALVCTVVRGGVLQSRKSLAAPGADIQMPTLTTEDKENLAIAAGCGVTGVMLPFVRGAADIRNLRQALAEAGAPQLKILAKIENLAGHKIPAVLFDAIIIFILFTHFKPEFLFAVRCIFHLQRECSIRSHRKCFSLCIGRFQEKSTCFISMNQKHLCFFS